MNGIQEKAVKPRVPFLAVMLGMGKFGKEIVVDSSKFLVEFFGTYEKEWKAIQRAFAEAAFSVMASRYVFRRTARMAKIWQAFWRLVWSYRMYKITSPLHSDEENKIRLNNLHEYHAHKYAESAIKLRGALLKIGQFASTRMDLLPAPYVKGLSQLQDSVPPVEYSLIEQQIENSLGARVDEIFASFDTEPVAAASIGQVHFATLKDGREVAVKIQYPGIEQIVKDDLWVLMQIMEKVEKIYEVKVAWIAKELCKYIEQELDYLNEAQNMKRFRGIFKDKADVIVPNVLDEYTTREVLVMERIEGKKITDWLDKEPSPEARKALLRTVLDAFCFQILRHGAFHADPHPGNFLVTEDRKLVMVDFGCCKIFDEKVRKGFNGLAQAIISQNVDEMKKSFKAIGFKMKRGQSHQETIKKLALLFLEVFMDRSEFGGAEIKNELGAVASEIKNNPFDKIPQDFVLLGRVFTSLGGLLEKYTPGERYEDVMLPYLFTLQDVKNDNAAVA